MLSRLLNAKGWNIRRRGCKMRVNLKQLGTWLRKRKTIHTLQIDLRRVTAQWIMTRGRRKSNRRKMRSQRERIYREDSLKVSKSQSGPWDIKKRSQLWRRKQEQHQSMFLVKSTSIEKQFRWNSNQLLWHRKHPMVTPLTIFQVEVQVKNHRFKVQ